MLSDSLRRYRRAFFLISILGFFVGGASAGLVAQQTRHVTNSNQTYLVKLYSQGQIAASWNAVSIREETSHQLSFFVREGKTVREVRLSGDYTIESLSKDVASNI